MRFCLSRRLKGIRLGTVARFHWQHHSLSSENNNGSEHLFSFFLIYLLISLELRKLQRGGLPPSVRNPKSEWSCSNNLGTLCLIWTKGQVEDIWFSLVFMWLEISFSLIYKNQSMIHPGEGCWANYGRLQNDIFSLFLNRLAISILKMFISFMPACPHTGVYGIRLPNMTISTFSLHCTCIDSKKWGLFSPSLNVGWSVTYLGQQTAVEVQFWDFHTKL